MLHTTPYQLRVVAFLKGAIENGSSETVCARLELGVCRSDILSQLNTAWTVDIETVHCIQQYFLNLLFTMFHKNLNQSDYCTRESASKTQKSLSTKNQQIPNIPSSINAMYSQQ